LSDACGGTEEPVRARRDCAQSLGALKGPPSTPQASAAGISRKHRAKERCGGSGGYASTTVSIRGTRCEPRGLTILGPSGPGGNAYTKFLDGLDVLYVLFEVVHGVNEVLVVVVEHLVTEDKGLAASRDTAKHGTVAAPYVPVGLNGGDGEKIGAVDALLNLVHLRKVPGKGNARDIGFTHCARHVHGAPRDMYLEVHVAHPRAAPLAGYPTPRAFGPKMTVQVPLRAREFTFLVETRIIRFRVLVHHLEILGVRLFGVEEPRVDRRVACRALDAHRSFLILFIQVQHFSHARDTLSPERVAARFPHRRMVLPAHKITRHPRWRQADKAKIFCRPRI